MADTSKVAVKPVTHENDAPASLVGAWVKVRPYFHVPVGRSCLRSTRSPWSHEASVIDVFGSQMVLVLYTWITGSPWPRKAAFYPRELHRRECACAACRGEGIPDRHGA